MGDVGYRGAVAGDLIALIEEKPHFGVPSRRRRSARRVPTSFVTLALGGRIDVPTLDGATAGVDVPAGSASGRVMRVRDRGLPGLRGGHGDLLARLVVHVPGRVSAAERKLLEELGRLDGLKPPRRSSKGFHSRAKDAFAWRRRRVSCGRRSWRDPAPR